MPLSGCGQIYKRSESSMVSDMNFWPWSRVSVAEERATAAARARRAWLAATIWLVLVATAAGSADASELVLSKEALAALVASTLFHDGGRWYVQKGACYVYLDHPVVSLSQGRMVIDARLSGKAGLEAQGTCIGVELSSPVAISGILHGSGSKLSVRDVRVDRATDDSTRQALGLLLGAASDSVSRALTVDLMTVVKPTAIPGLPMAARVTRLAVSDVATGAQSVTVRFDLGVAIP